MPKNTYIDKAVEEILENFDERTKMMMFLDLWTHDKEPPYEGPAGAPLVEIIHSKLFQFVYDILARYTGDLGGEALFEKSQTWIGPKGGDGS